MPKRKWQKLCDAGLSNYFFLGGGAGYNNKRTGNKVKINKWDSLKLKILLGKESNEQSERRPMDWDKIFANRIFDEGILSKI